MLFPGNYKDSNACSRLILGPSYAKELLLHHPQYQELDLLGCGPEGFTILAEDTVHGDAVAIKVFRCNDHNIERVRREAGIHKRLVHPHIIELREVLEWQGIIGLVMEYAVGGPLSTLVAVRNGLTETTARWYFQQVVMAVDYCHQKGFACRDIKLENVLLVNDAGTLVKLCISGCSRVKELRSPPGSLIGLPAHVAPEILLCAQSGLTHDGQRADMWSLGVLLFTMLTARNPFGTQKSLEPTAGSSYLRSLITGSQPRNPHFNAADISEQCMDLLMRLLQRDPDTRCRMGDVFHHPWFLSGLPPDATSMNRACIRSS